MGLAVLDACRDAANRWMFTDAGEPWKGLQAVYVTAAQPPTHYVDVTDTVDVAIQSLRAHSAYLNGLGGAFDPDAFLRGFARYAGEAAGCAYAVTFRHYSV
jgi:LmbE family N-acetylglucosaminyl deacetylase